MILLNIQVYMQNILYIYSLFTYLKNAMKFSLHFLLIHDRLSQAIFPKWRHFMDLFSIYRQLGLNEAVWSLGDRITTGLQERFREIDAVRRVFPRVSACESGRIENPSEVHSSRDEVATTEGLGGGG